MGLAQGTIISWSLHKVASTAKALVWWRLVSMLAKPRTRGPRLVTKTADFVDMVTRTAPES